MDLLAGIAALKQEQSIVIAAAGGAAGYVKRKNRSYVLVDNNNKERSCWGNLSEIVKDTEYFVENGKLRPPIGERW